MKFGLLEGDGAEDFPYLIQGHYHQPFRKIIWGLQNICAPNGITEKLGLKPRPLGRLLL